MLRIVSLLQKISRPKMAAPLAGVFLFCASGTARAGNWIDHSSKYKGLNSEIVELEQTINQLIKKKNKTKTARDIKSVTDEITSTYQKMLAKEKELAELKKHVKFKHPDQAEEFIITASGAKKKRSYRDRQLVSPEEIEREIGLDGRLDRIKKKVVGIFPGPKQEPITIIRRDPASEAKAEAKEMGFEQITLSK